MSDIHAMTEARVPQILEKQIVERKNKTAIAHDLGVSTKTIQRDVQTPLYEQIRDAFLGTYITRILEFANSEKDTFRLEGNKEIGRMLRQGMTRHTTHTEDLKLTADLTITDNRKRKDELFKSLELTPDQWRVIEDSVQTPDDTP